MATEEEAFLDGALSPSSVEFVGPFQHHEVVVNGFRVPFLTATPIPGGRVDLTLDSRYGLEVPVQDVERVVPFIADCIAVAMGFTCHPQEGWDGPVPRSPFMRRIALTSEDTGST